MSFNIDFVARQESAALYIDAEHAPECVKTFLKIGVTAFKYPEQLVHVKATGHLSDNGDFPSMGEMFVRTILVRA